MPGETEPPAKQPRTRARIRHAEPAEQLESALAQLREQIFQLKPGELANLADAAEQERVRGVLGLAEGVLRLAMTRTRVTRDGRAYVDPDLSAAMRGVELVARLLGVLELEAKAAVQLSPEQLADLMRRAGYEIRPIETTGAAVPSVPK